MYCGKYDVLCVTETWLHDGVNSGLLDPLCRFNILRNDRDSGYGGVAVFVQRDIRLVDITVDTVYESLELVCFDVIMSMLESAKLDSSSFTDYLIMMRLLGVMLTHLSNVRGSITL